jgi:PncC family amidohydrolase
MAEDPLPALVERLQDLCLAKGLFVATAESCTGGLVASLITDRAGSSGYFRGGVVAYADAVKQDLLAVSAGQLQVHGAVSAQVARSMAVGVRERLKADVAVAVTGVAGPGGGGDAKPVGLTYVACADGQAVEVRRFMWTGDRAANRLASARAALELLLERCQAGTGAAASAPGREGEAGPREGDGTASAG